MTKDTRRERTSVRLPPELHAKLTRQVNATGAGMNDIIVGALETAMAPQPDAKPITPKSDTIRLTIPADLVRQARAVAGADAPAWLRACMRRGAAIEAQLATMTARMSEAVAVQEAARPALAAAEPAKVEATEPAAPVPAD